MMSLPPTTPLTLCLIAATLLGAGIGACLWHLRSAARVARALADARRSADAERAALETTFARERESIAAKHARAHELVSRARAHVERARGGRDTLAARTREQARRVESLEAEVRAHEARRAAPRRDPADGAHRARVPADEAVPVLSRRVRGGPAAAADAPSPFPLGSDLDIPALAESELPEPTDDLALDLLDTKDLFDDERR